MSTWTKSTKTKASAHRALDIGKILQRFGSVLGNYLYSHLENNKGIY